FLGATGEPDLAHHSRSLIWHFPRSGVLVMANMWWEVLDVTIQTPGEWATVLDTTEPGAFVEDPVVWRQGAIVPVGPRSIRVLRSR
ncbi:MAG: hypothetical protein AAGG08_01550, partial [Actinomycetota bacterium]